MQLHNKYLTQLADIMAKLVDYSDRISYAKNIQGNQATPGYAAALAVSTTQIKHTHCFKMEHNVSNCRTKHRVNHTQAQFSKSQKQLLSQTEISGSSRKENKGNILRHSKIIE
eukprot:Ihof_evm3s819 gene=Ihof_evmTU3s819